MQRKRDYHKKIFIIYLLITPIVVFSFSGQESIKKIDRFVNYHYQNGDFNGCVLVAQNGKVIYENALGYTDYTASKTLTTDYQFRLASVSKQFTAMAVMILKENNKLKYDEKVATFLTDFPYQDITIRHLLTHTSGLPDYGSLLEQYQDFQNTVVSNKDVYALLIKYAPPREFKPGENYQYSNTGYAILALLVERISGMTFQSFLQDNIFSVLGMKNSYVNPANGKLDNTKRAKGFDENQQGTAFVELDWNYQNGMYGDGGVISNVHDMLLWDRALRSGKLVSDSTIDEAYTQVRLNDGSPREYGFGWSVIKQDSGKIVAHGGGWLGYTTGILRDLSTGQTVIQLCNKPSNRLIFKIWDILNGRDVIMPEMMKVTFKVIAKLISENDLVYITGNHKKLGNWNPAKIQLQNMGDNHWQRTIPIEKDFKLEYKFTRGSWETEAIYKKGVIPQNMFFTVSKDTIIEINIPFWKDK